MYVVFDETNAIPRKVVEDDDDASIENNKEEEPRNTNNEKKNKMNHLWKYCKEKKIKMRIYLRLGNLLEIILLIKLLEIQSKM